MLNEIEKLFEGKFASQKMQIKDFPRGCCKSINTHSFYFDDVTKDFFGLIHVGDLLRSMDIIHFNVKDNILIFGEMTSYNDYISTVDNPGNKDCLRFVRNQLLDTGFRNKIIHSIFTLLKIIDFYGLNKTVYAHLFDNEKIKIKHYLVLDLTYDQYIYIEFSCLDKLERHRKYRIEGEINILNCDAFESKIAG